MRFLLCSPSGNKYVAVTAYGYQSRTAQIVCLKPSPLEDLLTGERLVKTSTRVKVEYQYHGITYHVYTIPSYPFEVAQLLCSTVSSVHGVWKSPDDVSAEDIEAASVNVPESITFNAKMSAPLWYCRMAFDWMLRYCQSGGQQTGIEMPTEALPNHHHWRLLEAVAMVEVPLMNEVVRRGIRRLETEFSTREDMVACFDNFGGNHPARYSVLRRYTHVLLRYKDHGDHQARLAVIERIRDIEDVTGVNCLENWVGVDDALPTDPELQEYTVAADTQNIHNIAGDSSARQAQIRVRVELSRIDSIQEADRMS